MRTSRLTSFTAGALCMLVLGSGTAVAATGGKFILGRSNSATTTTTLSNSKGTALSLKAPSTKAALAVSNAVKVANLNADTVDGVSAEKLARTAGGTGYIEAEGQRVSSDDTQPGLGDLWVAYADCPAGSQVTGGGFSDLTGTGTIVDSSPGFNDDGTGYWQAVVSIDPTTANPNDDLFAYAVCWNPTKAPESGSAAMQRTSKAEVQKVLTPQLREAASAKAAQQ